MKKINLNFIFIISILISIVFCNSVYAADKKISCTYNCPYDENTYTIQTIVNISNEKDGTSDSAILKYSESVTDTVHLANATKRMLGYKYYEAENPFGLDGVKTFVQYYNKTESCPDFLYIYNAPAVHNDFVGLFLNDPDSVAVNGEPFFRCSSSNPAATKEKKSKNKKAKEEDVHTCTYIANVNTGKTKYDVQSDLSINLTKKTVYSGSIIFNEKSFLKKSCPNVFMCVDQHRNDEMQHDIYLSDNKKQMLKKLIPLVDSNFDYDSYCEDKSDDKCINKFKYDFSFSCGTISNDKKSNLTVGTSSCGRMDSFIEDLENYKKNKQYSNINDTIDTIRNYCRIILEYSNYGTNTNDCLHACLDLNTYIGKYIYKNSENGECNLSDNLLKWIKNIMKWIKFILPVLVIILGILDFIKAIASDSEDEMKKAQGRFVKRLIAAALLFILPALIEFIFTIFKLGENPFCGIVD